MLHQVLEHLGLFSHHKGEKIRQVLLALQIIAQVLTVRLPHQFVDALLHVLLLNGSCCANLSRQFYPQVQSGALAVLGLLEHVYEFIKQSPLVDFENDVLGEFDFAQELLDVFGVEVQFEQFDEHRDESLFEEGVDAFDAVVEDVDDEDV